MPPMVPFLPSSSPPPSPSRGAVHAALRDSAKKGAKQGKKCGGAGSAANFDLQKRHIKIDGKKTTIALEGVYWRLLDRCANGAGQTWEEWTQAVLDDLPASVAARARWLRLSLVDKVSI